MAAALAAALHGVRFRVPIDGALVAAAMLSDRYISDRFLPDKAVDLIDEAASRLKIELDSMPTEIDQIERQVLQLEMEKKALEKLRHACKTYGTTNVLLLPFQPREQLPEMLAAADVGLVVQKRNVIGFNMPSKIQVLLASGRPIIASVPTNGTAARAIHQSTGGVVVGSSWQQQYKQ